VIPQIILSGAISPLEGLSKALALVGVSTYWGKRGLDGCLPESIPVPERHAVYPAVLVLLLHATLAVALTVTVLHLQSRRRK
jgi:hypothetical protein